MYQQANSYRYKEPEKYKETISKFLAKEMKRRINLLRAVSSDAEKIKTVVQYSSIRENLVSWICDWCWTYDPRNANIGLPPTIPWILWPRQIQFIEWFYNLYLSQEGGLVEKSRDAGATWLFCVIFLREWRWEPGFAAGIGSNKLNSVDHKDNPKSVFTKIRALLYGLPAWWFPKGFERKQHDKIANLVNPENGANLGGEGGDDIGRGDRRSVYLVDEKASLEHPDMADSALSQTTNSQFDLSTPKGMNNFATKRHGGKVKVFTFHWKEDARKNQAWHDHEADRLDPVIVAQEINIDYHASVEGICIPAKWVEAAVELDIKAEGIVVAGLDVAVGGRNKSAYVKRHGSVVDKVISWNFDNTTEIAHRAIEEGEKDCIRILNYDSIGVGQGVHGTVRSRERQPRFKYYALEGGDAVSDDYWEEFQRAAKEIFLNARAERWYRVKKRFEKTYKYVKGIAKYPASELISIPRRPQLIAELSSPLEFRTESGKIKIESKESMKGRGIASPDEADALVYAFSTDVGDLGNYVFYGFDYTPKEKKEHSTYWPFKINWHLANFKHQHDNYGVTFFQKDMGMSHLSCFWDGRTQILWIYDAIEEQNRPPAYLMECVKLSLRNGPVKKYLCNKDMLPKKGEETITQVFRKGGIRFRFNRKYEEKASKYIVNELFLRRQIKVHSSLDLAKRQFSMWKNGDDVKDYGLCAALCNLVFELKERGELKKLPPLRGYETKAQKEKWRRDFGRQKEKVIDTTLEDGGAMM